MESEEEQEAVDAAEEGGGGGRPSAAARITTTSTPRYRALMSLPPLPPAFNFCPSLGGVGGNTLATTTMLRYDALVRSGPVRGGDRWGLSFRQAARALQVVVDRLCDTHTH